ncbi:MAG: NADH dehydrogenase (quinone) subunit D [Chloroflexi bacterium]|nr:NADH dehydrogenase (quinone) subunit D [Chloroflexota bacterium]
MPLTREDLTTVTGIESDQQTLEVSLDQLKNLVSPRAFTGETMLLNMGPQHPSTHGVLRLLLELDGETIVTCLPDVGYLHTGIEKNMEAKTYEKALVMTDRIDYLNNLGNNLVYSLAIEKLVELDVPPRAQFIRVIIAELQRIASHLVWMATHVLDMGATSVMLYAFRDREYILDMFEMVSGQRLMGSYIRPGGVWRDLVPEFMPALHEFVYNYMPYKLDDYERLLNNNPFWLDRTKGIGVITAEEAQAWGLTGAPLRATGINFDLRKAEPYAAYPELEFDVPLAYNGDVFDRYYVRIQEMREALRIIRQAMEVLPGGPFRSDNRKFVPPPRSELGHSMEAVIHHFKLWTEGFHAPKGEVYVRVESPRGELGVYLVGDGGPKPYRVHWRTPSFYNVQAIGRFSPGYMLADLIGIIGSLDFTLGDCDR